jgi:hypothetical protein
MQTSLQQVPSGSSRSVSSAGGKRQSDPANDIDQATSRPGMGSAVKSMTSHACHSVSHDDNGIRGGLIGLTAPSLLRVNDPLPSSCTAAQVSNDCVVKASRRAIRPSPPFILGA